MPLSRPAFDSFVSELSPESFEFDEPAVDEPAPTTGPTRQDGTAITR